MAPRYDHRNVEGLITSGAGNLTVVVFTPQGGNTSGTLYDGVDATGDIIMVLDALDGIGFSPNLGEGLQFDIGVYYVPEDANAHLTVGYIPNGF